MNKKSFRIPLGIDDFRKIRNPEENFLYCDKSLFIRDVLYDGAEALTLLRPPHFGKTLNLSLLHHFLGGEDPSLFKGLKITEDRTFFEKHQGKYTSIFFTMKDLKTESAKEMILSLSSLIQKIFSPYRALFKDPDDEIYFNQDLILEEHFLKDSLYYLCETLLTELKKPVILLIDDFDAPLRHAYLNGFYEEVSLLIRCFLETTLKTNPYLEKAVLTGVTTIPPDSLFSGLNHLAICGVESTKYETSFGFTEEEVKELTADHYEEIKNWYSGYTIRNTTLYNPWSIMSCIANNYQFGTYWLDKDTTPFLEHTLTLNKLPSIHALLEGTSIKVHLDCHVIFDKISWNSEMFFNFLYVSGYLTAEGPRGREYTYYHPLRIPNKEIFCFFEQQVSNWFRQKIQKNHPSLRDFFKELLTSLQNDSLEEIEKLLNILALEALICPSESRLREESFYHGLVLGLTLELRGHYSVKSNRESYFKDYEIVLSPKDPTKEPGILIEVKVKEPNEPGLEMADKEEYKTLLQEGCQKICLYTLCFKDNRIEVRRA